MAGNKVVFSSVKTTKNINDKKLEVDADGYYTIILGALNVFNSGGAFYDFNKSKEVFSSSSVLMRRIKNGFLKAEVGHPKRTPGMTMNEYMNRIIRIEETNVCAHIKEVSLEDSGKSEDGVSENIIYIVGKVKPMGPKADFLKASLEDEHANVAFSIRSLTQDTVVNGTVIKALKTVVCWDFVIEPGISHATKWKTLGIESLDLLAIDTGDTSVKASIEENLKECDMVATEDSKAILESVMDAFDCNKNNSCILHDW